MLETEKGKRMEQVLVTGATREQLAEALWCAERSVAMWSECAEARIARMRELENDAVEHYFETVELRNENAKLCELAADMHGWLVVNHEKHYVIPRNGLDDIERDMRELGIEVEDD